MRHSAYIALGSNLGDRAANIASAIDRINALPLTCVTRVAEAIETEPVDAPVGSPRYLNTAASLSTESEALALLRELLVIETRIGRRRPGLQEVNAPRPIDLDLLLFDDRVMSSAELTLPHPRMHLRRFVLEPLASIAPDVVHPTTGKTIATLLRGLQDA